MSDTRMDNPVTTIDLRNLPALTNDAYYPLYADKSRYLALKGGGSSGKSVFAAQKIIFRLLHDRPKRKKHRFLVVRKVKADLRDSCYEELKGVISAWGLDDLFHVPRGRSSDLYLQCKLNGNEIIFYGLDDVERRKSIQGITGMWIEEASELEATDFRQLDIRMRGKTEYYKQIIISFNPVNITHWLKKEFFDQRKPGTTVSETTYRDNRFLDSQAIKVLEDFKDTDEYYYTVYCLGQWGVIGKTVYAAGVVTRRLLEAKGIKPLLTGSFAYEYVHDKIIDDSIKFIDDDNGFIRIYELPMRGHPYVIGGDTAEGGVDFSAGSVRNNVTWTQAAVLRGHMDTDLYTKQMYCLGRYFNNALIGIETNFDLHPVKELQRLGYTDQYVRVSLDKYTNAPQKTFGFKTTKITRPVIIASHVALVRDSIDTFNDYATLEEMLTFVRDESGKPAAQSGHHDDMILADAIALEIRTQGRLKVKEAVADKSTIAKHKEQIARDYLSRKRRRVALS